jgi:hypothetical protein
MLVVAVAEQIVAIQQEPLLLAVEQAALILMAQLLEMELLILAVVVVADLQQTVLVVRAVQEYLLFLTQAHNVAQAELLHPRAEIQSTHLHLVAHTRLNHAKHNQCTSRQLYNHHSAY